MNYRSIWTLSLAALLIVSCSAEVESRTNPFDPVSTNPAPARLLGTMAAPGLADLAGLEVRMVPVAAEDAANATLAVTDSEGAFDVEVEPGRYNLRVAETGYQELVVYAVQAVQGEIVDLGVLQLVPLSDTEDASTLAGKFLLEAADVHAGIQVRVVGWPFEAHTAADGTWAMTISAGTYKLEVSYPDYQTVLVEGVEVGVAEDVTLPDQTLLAEPASISGTVQLETCTADPADAVTLPADGALVSALGTGQTGTVAPDGTFTVTGLYAGVYTLRASLDGYVNDSQSGLSVRGGDALTLSEPFVLPAARGDLVGFVLRSGDSDHSGTVVTVTGTSFVALTAADGSFRIPGVCAGTGYEISARYEGFLAGSVPGLAVTAGQRTDIGTVTLARQQGGLTLNGGGDYTGATDRVVSYSLAAPTGTTEMRMSEEEALFTDPARADEGWVAYVQDDVFTLSTGEGTKTVYAQVRSSGGASGVLKDDVVLDLTAPTGPQVTIEDGDGYTNDSDGSVLLELIASDAPAPGVDRVSGLAWVKLLNHDLQDTAATAPSDPLDTAWDTATAVGYQRILDHPLLRPTTDEEKEVWVRFGDQAGNWSVPVSARVVLDRQAPDTTSITIQGSAVGYANTTIVAVALTAADENPGMQMRLANESTFAGAVWRPYASLVDWFLDGQSDGSKSVWVEFRDAAGNLAQALEATVTLDRAAPSGVRLTIDNGAYVAAPGLTLTLAASGADEMQVAHRPDFTDDTGADELWSAFSTAGSHTLPSTDGSYTVYARFRDAAQNVSVVVAEQVVLDQTAPAAPVVTIAEGTDVSNPTITVQTVAVTGPTEAWEQRIDVVDVGSGTTSTGTWGPYAPSVAVTLAAPSGAKDIVVTLRDAAGNESPATTVRVNYDPDPPVLNSVTLAGGATWIGTTAVDLAIDATGADLMKLSNRADYAGSAWQPFAAAVAWNLPAVDGSKTVYVSLADTAGNTVSGSATVSLDRTPPNGLSVELAGGASFDVDGTVDLVLSAADAGSGMGPALVSNEPGFAAATSVPWTAGDPSVTVTGWTLAAGDGLRTVYVRFVDAVGNTVDAAGSIVVDASPPTGAVTIDAGATWTTGTSVTLTSTAPPDVSRMAVANGSIDCATATWQAFTSPLAWTLDGAADGTKTVAVCFEDAAGNQAQTSDTIILDTTPPTGTVTLDGGATHTTQRAVVLTLTAPPDTTRMAIANGPTLDCATATYEAYGTSRSWTIAAGDGTREVTVCFADGAGNQSSATGSIVLDTTAPAGAIDLASGAAQVNTAAITVALTFPGDTAGYAIADATLDCASAAYTAVTLGDTSASASWTLPAGDGTKVVVACFTDTAGNTASAVDTVVLDGSSPTGTVTIDGGATWATGTSVSLVLTADADVVDMSVANTSLDCATATWQAFAGTVAWTLDGAADGVKTVVVCLRDGAGNLGQVTGTIRLDTTPPTGTVSINGGAAFATAAEVSLTLTADSDVTGLAVADTSLDCATATYDPFVPARGWTLPVGDGLKTVAICVKDGAGLTGAASDTIELDTARPTGSVSLAGGAAYATSTSVTVDLTLAADTIGYALADGTLDCAGASYTAVTAGTTAVSTTWTLPSGDGTKTVVACFQDEAGLTALAADGVILDTSNPVGTVTIAGGATYTQAAAVTLSFQAPTDTTEVAVVNAGSIDCSTATYQAFTSTLAWTLDGATEGLKTVSVCFRDAAQLTAVAMDTITLDTINPTGTVSINAGDVFTQTRSVILDLTWDADVDQMAVGGAGLDCATAGYFAATTPFGWTLGAGNGTKTVTVCFKDLSGRTASATDTIDLDETNPVGTLSLGGGSAYTTTPTVTADLTFPNDTNGYVLVDGFSDCTTVTFTAVTVGTTSLTVNHTLPSPDGSKVVTACLRDQAGNVSPVSDTITVDTVDPVGSLSIADGATYVTAAGVTLTFLGVSTDVAQVAVVDGATIDCATATYQAYSQTLAWTLPAGDGAKTISACLKDASGRTISVSDAVTLDATAPSGGSIVINGGAGYAITRGVTLELTRDADVVRMALGNGALDCAAAAYEPYATPRAWTVSAGEGTKTVTVCFQDGAGLTASASDTIVLDTVRPAGTVDLAGGADYVNSATVTADFTFPNDTNGYAVVEGNLDCGTATYTPVTVGNTTASTTVTLTPGEGFRTVTACFQDVAGNVASAGDAVVIDTQAPTGSVTIAAGAGWTTTAAVTLSFDAPADTAMVSVADGAVLDCATATYQAYSSTLAWTLPGTDGAKTVTACFKDVSGLTATASDDIILDTTPPSGSVTIEGGAAYTQVRSILLTIVPDDATRMSVANGTVLDCATAAYEPVATTRPWTLAVGDGTRTVSVCLKDAAGWTQKVIDDITLDSTPPAGSFTLPAYVNTTAGSFTVSHPNDVVGYAVANASLDCSSAAYTAVTLGSTSTPIAHNLSSGDGTKTVVVCLEDAAGNQASTAATTILDTTPPAGSVLIDGGAEFALTTLVNVTLDAPADTVQMSVVEGASLDCATATYEAYATTKSLTLSGNGIRQVTACFKDGADLTASATDSITVDTVDPSGTLTIDGGATHTREVTVDLAITGTADTVAVAFANGGSIDCATAGYEPYSATRTWSLPAGDGTKTVSACLKDAAGRTVSLSDTITLDTVAPSTATVSIDGGAAFTTDAAGAVTLTLSTPETVTTAIANEANDCSLATYGAFAASEPWTLKAEDGLRTVVVCFKDAAGWVVSKQDTIVLDRVAPAGSLTIDGGAAYTIDALVDLAITAPADTVSMSVANTAQSCAAATYTAFSSTVAGWDLNNPVVADGPATVSVCLKDGAGLTSEALGTIVLDRTNPAGSIVLAGGATAVKETSVPVELTTTSTDVVSMAVAEGSIDCATALYGAYQQFFDFTVSSSQGAKTVLACLKDAAGRTAQVSDSVTLDSIAPVGAVSINAGAGWATTLSVSLGITLGDAVEMKIGNESADCSSSTGYEAAATSKAWTLLDQDGLRTVKVCLKDAAGNVADVVDDIWLDRVAPAGQISINQDAVYATTAGVTLQLTAPSDTVQMRVADGADCTSGILEAFATTKPWSLPGLDGTKEISVCFYDGAGLSATASDDIILDTQAPTGNSVTATGTIADGANSTTLTGTQAVTLSLASTGATEMLIANDSGFSSATWQSYTSPVPWTLIAGDGSKTVYVRYRDAAGLTTGTVSASITLDTRAPTTPTVTIEGGAPAINVTGVNLDLGATGADQMRLSKDGIFDTELWKAYATTDTITLDAVDGRQVVYAVFRDLAGNESVVVVDDIDVDLTSPTVFTVVMDGGRGYTNSVSVTATFKVQGADEMRVSTDGVFDDESWVAFAETSVQLLPSGDCTDITGADCKNVCAYFRDTAQNTVGPFCDAITLDTTPPTTPPVTTADGVVNAASATINTSGGVTEHFFDRYELLSAPSTTSFTTASTVQSTTAFSAPLASDRQNTITLRAVDLAGNASPEATVIIVEDSVNPIAPVITSASTTVNADTFTVYIAQSVTSDSNFDHYELFGGGFGTWTSTSQTDGFIFGLVQGDGVACSTTVPCTNTLQIRAVDKAGNVGPVDSVVIYEDSTVPTTPRIWPRSGTVNAQEVTMRLVTNSSDASGTVTYQVQGGASFNAYTDSTETELFDFPLIEDQTNQLCVRARDIAGNFSDADCVDIVEQSSEQLTTTPEAEFNPDVFGDFVVFEWESLNGNNHEIRMVDLGRGPWPNTISTWDTNAARWPRVNSNAETTLVVYVEQGFVKVYQKPNDSSISATTSTISTEPSPSYPDIWGGYVVYISGGNLYYRNCNGPQTSPCTSTTAPKQLTTTGRVRGKPRLTGVVALWAEDKDNNGVAELYRMNLNLAVGSETRVDGGVEPSYDEMGAGYYYKAWAAGGVIRYVDTSASSPTVTSVAAEGVFDVSGGKILYKHAEAGANPELYVLDTWNGNKITRVTNQAGVEAPASMSFGRIVWQDGRDVQFDIHSYDLAESKWLVSHPSAQENPVIRNDIVAWNDSRSIADQVAWMDMTVRIENFASGQSGTVTDFGGDFIAFNYDNGTGTTQQKVHNYLTSATTVLASDSPSIIGPVRISPTGTRATWGSFAGLTGYVKSYALPPPSTPVSEASGFLQSYAPDVTRTSGDDIIFWESGYYIYCKNLNDGTTGIVYTAPDVNPADGTPDYPIDRVRAGDDLLAFEANGKVYAATADCASGTTDAFSVLVLGAGGVHRNPNVDENGWFVWETDQRNWGYWDVKIYYRFAGDDAFLLRNVSRLAPLSTNQTAPSIHNGRVVWTDYRGGDADIWTFLIP